MSISNIRKTSISDQVFEQIKSNILKGEWAVGDKIPSETELSKQFGVSRVPIREALKNLNVLGILETRHGEGSFVCEPTPGIVLNSLVQMLVLNNSQLIEVLEFRRIIEVESARIAAQKATEEDILMLKESIEKMSHLDKSESKSVAKQDHDFHTLIAKATKNSLIIQVNLIIADLLMSQHEEIRKVTGFLLPLEHKQLVDAIEKKDSELAASIMKAHIDSTIVVAQNMDK